MLGNTFGRMFRVTTVGESYGIGEGSGLAVIIDGVPPGIELSDKIVQEEMDKRRPGVGKLNSPRKETDQCHIFAGLGQEGMTTGAPVGIIIYNVDTQQIHIDQYHQYKDLCRPGHATFSFFKKYGESQDWCGAGRSSGRETVGRVAGGAVAKVILEKEGIDLICYTTQCMEIKARDMSFDEAKSNYRKNEINCPDLEAAEKMEKRVLEIKDEGDTAGGILELRIKGVPAGLGEPVFDKLSSLLGHAILSIGAIKGIEFGAGFQVGSMKGSECNDEFCKKDGSIGFKTNNSGGILGGISNGDEIVVRVAVKPTPTISLIQDSVNMPKNEIEKLEPITRRDPTLLGRIYSVVESMAAVTLVDALMMARGYDQVCRPENKWREL
ncbi:MAG: chorismate synthase [Deltaproteobacteria bacterium]|nr:chorismate synthase [Deltaproteobacteria bacterium]